MDQNQKMSVQTRWMIIGLQKSQKMDIDIAGKQARWIKYSTWSCKKKKKKERSNSSRFLANDNSSE